jgi:hypothetical protein
MNINSQVIQTVKINRQDDVSHTVRLSHTSLVIPELQQVLCKVYEQNIVQWKECHVFQSTLIILDSFHHLLCNSYIMFWMSPLLLSSVHICLVDPIERATFSHSATFATQGLHYIVDDGRKSKIKTVLWNIITWSSKSSSIKCHHTVCGIWKLSIAFIFLAR